MRSANFDIPDSMQIEEVDTDKKENRSRIWQEVEVEGVKMGALIDTGASFCFMNLRTARLHFQHIPWKAAVLIAKTTSGETLKVVAQHDLRLKIGKAEAVHKLYVIQDSQARP